MQRFFQRHSSIAIALGLALPFFVIQLSFINDYGVSWDEPLHRNWGKIFSYFLRTGDRRLLELMPGHGIDYGPVYYFVNFLLSEKLYVAHLFSFVAANHLLNLITASVAVFFLFLLAQSFAGLRIAFLSVLFFVFFPPFLAHAHYNPKDIPLLTAVLITATVFKRSLELNKRRFFCLSGLFFGMCIALKVSAILMSPAFIAAYAVQVRSRIEPVHAKDVCLTIFLVALSVMIGAIALWPSAWGDLRLIARSILFFTHDFWPGKVLYFGKEYAGGDLPWFYIPLEYLMTMPLVTVLSFVLGLSMVVRFLFHASARTDVLFQKPFVVFLLFWVLFPLLVSMKPHLVRYDSMRQFFFCLPAIAILAAVGFDAMIGRIGRSMTKPFLIASLCIAVAVLSLAHEASILHPFEGSYRNELVRFSYPMSMDQTFQIEYWGATYLQGMQWLIEHADRNPVICVPTAGILVTWYSWRDDFTFECSEKSNYLMFFTRYSEAQQYVLQVLPPIFTIDRMGATLLKIYKVK